MKCFEFYMSLPKPCPLNYLFKKKKASNGFCKYPQQECRGSYCLNHVLWSTYFKKASYGFCKQPQHECRGSGLGERDDAGHSSFHIRLSGPIVWPWVLCLWMEYSLFESAHVELREVWRVYRGGGVVVRWFASRRCEAGTDSAWADLGRDYSDAEAQAGL